MLALAGRRCRNGLRLSHKPKRLYEIDNNRFQRPRGAATDGRSEPSPSEKTRFETGVFVTNAQKVEDPNGLCDTLGYKQRRLVWL